MRNYGGLGGRSLWGFAFCTDGDVQAGSVALQGD